MAADEREHLDRVRERFTRTAEQFARFALTTRREEAQRLAELAAPRGNEIALDLACGPGTFTQAFAARLGFLCGLDVTPAMLLEARQTLARAGLVNVAFACGDANALPFSDSSLDLAICSYSFHHFLAPARIVGELSRVLRPHGRLAAVDLIVPDGADAEWNNRIERARDASHATTLSRGAFLGLLDAAGLRVQLSQIGERLRRFDDWMRIVGCPPGTPAYAETRRLIEASLPEDAAGFHPHLVPGSDELEFVQTSLFLVAEKC